MRVLQGAAIGGEMPGAWVFVAEHVPARRYGFAVGTLTAGITGGILLGSLVAVAINTHYAPADVHDFAWRIPFILGGVFGLVSVYLRRFLTLGVAEDPEPVYSRLDNCDGLGARRLLGVAERRALVDVDNTVRDPGYLMDYLGRVLRGWANYFRHGVSKAIFNAIDSYAWERITSWLRKKHRIGWPELRRRFCLPGTWRLAHDGQRFRGAATVTVTWELV
jgi:MFS family permease